MMIGYVCDKCGKMDGITNEGYPEQVNRLRMHIEKGWYISKNLSYCRDCLPSELAPRDSKHPKQTMFNCLKGCHEQIVFLDEPYDPFYEYVLYELCKCCKHHEYEYESDGSRWAVCRVDGDGHNLYSGHTSGGPVRGRLCPYWGYDDGFKKYNPGKDPETDIADGTFEPPYNEIYDWD